MHLALIVAQILAASLAIAGKLVLREVPAGLLVLVRASGAALVLGLVHRAAGLPGMQDREAVRKLALLGLLGVSANQSLFLLGLERTAAVNASILVTTIPVFTVAIAVLAGRERFSRLKGAGIGLAAVGAVYMIGPDRLHVSPRAALGNLLLILGMAAYAGYLVLARPLLARHHPLTVSAYVMGFGALGAVPLAVRDWGGFAPGRVSASTWALLVYVVAFPTIVTYFLNIWALGRASSSLVAAFVYLQPILTAAVAPMVLVGEGLTPRSVGAGLAIFSGLACVISGEYRERRVLEPVVGE